MLIFLRFLKLYSAIQNKKVIGYLLPKLTICFLSSKPLAYKLGETNLFFKLEKYVCKTQIMPHVDPIIHFIRLPKVSLGPALNSFEYLSKFQLHNKSLVFKGCNLSQAFRNMDMTKEHISFTFNPKIFYHLSKWALAL